MSIRNSIISNLATLVSGIAGVNTVVVANEKIDLQQFKVRDLPLIEIRVEKEEPEYETGRTGYWFLSLMITVYFLDNQNDNTQRESLNEKLKNKIGSDPTLSEVCEMCEIITETSGGVFPLYEEEFSVLTRYERGIANA